MVIGFVVARAEVVVVRAEVVVARAVVVVAWSRAVTMGPSILIKCGSQGWL